MNSKDRAFARKIESNALKTIKKYRLLNKREKIAVAASGGKDSTAVMHILNKLGYNIAAVTVDVQIGSYTKKNVENLVKFCSEQGITLYVIDIRKEIGCSICYMKSTLESKGIKLNSCAVCGVVRRYILNKAAKELKAKKLVTGHNLDDEVQSIMMNFFRNTLQMSARLGPSSGTSKEKRFIPRVKPLYFIPEKDIERYSKIMKFPVNYERCPCSAVVFRNFVRNLLDEQEKSNPKIKQNIMGNFLKIQPKLKKMFKAEKYTYCPKCGEPSKSGICRACQIIIHVKPKRLK